MIDLKGRKNRNYFHKISKVRIFMENGDKCRWCFCDRETQASGEPKVKLVTFSLIASSEFLEFSTLRG